MLLLAVGLAAYGLVRLTGATQLLASTYTNADFGIDPYVSPFDADGDGLDDQSDIVTRLLQVAYEEDILEERPVMGHFRIEGMVPVC